MNDPDRTTILQTDDRTDRRMGPENPIKIVASKLKEQQQPQQQQLSSSSGPSTTIDVNGNKDIPKMTSTTSTTTPATQTQEPTKQSGSASPVFASQLRLPPLLQNLLETPTLTEKVCQKRTSEMLSMMAEDSNDHQNRKKKVDQDLDDPLMNKYVATPGTPTGKNTSSSLFSTTSPITTCDSRRSKGSLVSPTTIKTRNVHVLRLDEVSSKDRYSSNNREYHVTSPSTRPVPFSPSMLLDRYEQHRRRASLEEMRRNPSSLVAPCLVSKLVITGQTKASAKESSSATLDGDHVPLRKRVRLEESLQSKDPFTTTKATLDIGGCHHHFPNAVYPSKNHPQCLRDGSDQHRNHHHQFCPLQSPPSLPAQYHSPVSDFLRRRYHANKASSSSSPTVTEDQTGSAATATATSTTAAVTSDVYPAVEVVLPPPPSCSAANKTQQRQGGVMPPIPSFQTSSGFPLPRATNSKW